jgi:Protein of unknown function (DUF3187)
MRKLLCAAALTAAISPAAANAAEFFQVGNDNPLLRGIYQPRAADSRAGDAAQFSAGFSLANTLNVESRSQQQLLVDGESDTLRLAWDAPFAAAWRYRFSVPLIHDSGGFLDSTINAWHRFFGLPRGERPNYSNNRLDYFYSGTGHVDLQSSQTRLGDTAAEVGWFAADDDARTLSIWGGLEAPTGSARHLTGDGAWDGALWVHAARRYSHGQLGAELGAVQSFGDEIFAGHAHRTSAFARAAASWLASREIAVRIQLDAQSARLKQTQLRFLGPSLLLSLGASVTPNPRWAVDFGFAEDAAVNTAPDFTLFLTIRRHFAH